ncbi:MAG: type II toxin-antitoxin system mRNA interferase toxin, RelE/StbE family [Nanoarchaeota archaeon]|nr:type II toxin-antitoxin system mRNA interferase toxin, RelE/StbE family [Nanoarchaeota archaeon]
MIYTDEYTATFVRKLKKLKRKDKRLFKILMKKVDTIIMNPLHFPMLHYNLREFRHAHFDKSFVIIYKIEGKKIKFMDFGHHDEFFRR